jgi:hypothetical protein
MIFISLPPPIYLSNTFGNDIIDIHTAPTGKKTEDIGYIIGNRMDSKI